MEKININQRIDLQAGRTNAKYLDRRDNRVILSKPGTVWIIDADGVEHLIGYGHDLKFQLEDATDVKVWASVQGIFLSKENLVYQSQGEVFTNFDKRPNLSPIEQSVKLALRRLHNEQRQLQLERDAINRQMMEGKPAKNPPPEEPVDETIPDPEARTEPEPTP